MAGSNIYDDVPGGVNLSIDWMGQQQSLAANQQRGPQYIGQYIPSSGIPGAVQAEADPSGLDAKTPGAKLDDGKSPIYQGLLDYFPRACLMVADVSAVGARKYSWKGWEKVADGPKRYADALVRHIAKEAIEGPIDSDTGLLHKAQIAWNALAMLELILREQEKRG